MDTDCIVFCGRPPWCCCCIPSTPTPVKPPAMPPVPPGAVTLFSQLDICVMGAVRPAGRAWRRAGAQKASGRESGAAQACRGALLGGRGSERASAPASRRSPGVPRVFSSNI